jgi:hypothetical protein
LSSARARSIFHPVVDALCTGGLSLIVFAAILFFAPRPLKGHDYGTLFALGCLLNWPHFIGSYRLLYATRQSVQTYRAASTIVPLLLAAWVAVALFTGASHPAVSNSLIVVGSVYLARHYTGQTWGMMASFAHLSGAPFSTAERRVVRLSLDLLMVWHGLWAAAQTIGLVWPAAARALGVVYPWAGWLRLAALIVGMFGLAAYARRHRQLPPARVLVPWAAINLWYALLAVDASALLAVQLGHALQYLIFPLRVQLNRAQSQDWKAAIASYAAWTVIGVAVFEGLEPLLRLGFVAGGGSGAVPGMAATSIISAIGIHHYFIDGALYKLRNPEVRRDLFAHLEAASPPARSATSRTP